jgi:hypothetical protein
MALALDDTLGRRFTAFYPFLVYFSLYALIPWLRAWLLSRHRKRAACIKQYGTCDLMTLIHAIINIRAINTHCYLD